MLFIRENSNRAFKDIFISKTPNSNSPNNYSIAPNNTTSIISINLLSAIGLINKSKAPLSKLQKVLIRDEEDSYIDHLFSKRKVASITTLKDDSLSEFMNRYRPSAKDLRKMKEYDLIRYIKNNYQQFISGLKNIFRHIQKIKSINNELFVN